MATISFTKSDRDKLETLLKKKRQAEADERKALRQKNKICKELFNLTVKETKERLDLATQYDELKSKVTKLMSLSGKSFDDFDKFIDSQQIKHDNVTDRIS